MNAFNTRLFWLYGLAGGFLLLTLYLPLSCTVLSPNYDPTPEYAAHLKEAGEIDAWLSERSLNHDKIEFYEALSGKRELKDVRKAGLREAARGLLDRMPVDGKKAEDFRIGFCMLQMNRSFYECANDSKAFRGDLDILNEPHKVAWLMSGSPDRAAAVLPAIPERYRQYPAWPAEAVKYRSVTVTSGWVKWTVMSLVFALGFFILRAVLKACDLDEAPFRSSTETAFSRLVLAGFAPGFVFFTGLHMLTPEGKVARFHLRRMLRLTSFDDEHEALILRLAVMREKALRLDESNHVVRQIDDALGRIRRTKDFEELSKIQAEAEDIDTLYIAKAELESELS